MDRIAPIEQPTSNQDKLHYNTVALKSAQRLTLPHTSCCIHTADMI